MAKKTNTYQPSAEQMELVRRYFGGDQSEGVLGAIRRLMMNDADFAAFFKKLQAQMKSTQGMGDNWRIGTHGASVGGGDTTISALGRGTKGTSAWNQYRMNRAGYNGAVTSPGGFKASGRDEDSALRRSGLVSGDRVEAAVSFGRKGATINGKTYSKDEVDAILKRGLSGATMNWKDQAIYDALGGYGNTLDEVYANRKAEIRHERELRRKAEEEEQRVKDTDDYNRIRLGIGRGYNLTPAQMAAIREGRATFRNGKYLTNEDLYKEGIQRTKAAADAYEAMDKRRNKALDYASKLVKAGTHEWTKSQRELMQKLQDEIDRVSSDANMNSSEKEKTRRELEQRLYYIRTNPHEKIIPDETNDENFTKNTRTDERGIIWAKDANGSWKVAYNPKDYEAEDRLAQIEENRRIRAQERADARADKIQARKDAWLDARIAALQKPTKVRDDIGVETDIPGLSYEDAYNQATKEMDIRFPKQDETDEHDETDDQDEQLDIPTSE